MALKKPVSHTPSFDTSFLLLLSPKSQLAFPIYIPAAKPKTMVYTIYIWISDYNLSQTPMKVLWPGFPCTAAGAWWDVHAFGIKFKLLHLGLCWGKHHVTLCVTVPGTALCQCLAPLLGECWRGLGQKTMKMEKLAWSLDRITSPYASFRKSTYFFNTSQSL